MHLEYTLIEGDFVNAGSASSSIKKTLKQLNVNPAIVKRVVIALYEAEVNAVAHAYGGKVTADIEADKILMRVIDRGPGIPDIEWAMKEGNSTASQEVRNMGVGAGGDGVCLVDRIKQPHRPEEHQAESCGCHEHSETDFARA